MTAALSRRAAIALATAAAVGGSRVAAARVGPDSFAPLVKRVLPAVVNIGVIETQPQGDDPLSLLPPEIRRQFRGRLPEHRREVHASGSGFIITPDGYLVTLKSAEHGAIQFAKPGWKSAGVQPISISLRGEKYEAMLLLGGGDWVESDLGRWQVDQGRCGISLDCANEGAFR